MIDLLEHCLVVVAGICLSAPATIEIESNSVWTGGRIKIENALVVSTVRSDNLPFPDRRKMTKYCSGSQCVFYYRYCSSSGSKFICVIHYNEPFDESNRTISIIGRSRKIVDTAASRLSLVNAERMLVPLSEFTVVSSDSIPPYCRPKLDSFCR
jgi:hypothetical protein